jgi:hypothetical protein
MRADELSQRVDSAETQIARATAASAVLFKMLEKSTKQARSQITDSQPIDWGLEKTAHEWEQQNHRIPVTALSIAG